MTGPGSDGLAVRMAHGWLRLATDDFTGAAPELSEAAPAALHGRVVPGRPVRFTWLARSHFSTATGTRPSWMPTGR